MSSNEIKAPLSPLLSAKGMQKRMKDTEPRVPAKLPQAQVPTSPNESKPSPTYFSPMPTEIALGRAQRADEQKEVTEITVLAPVGPALAEGLRVDGRFQIQRVKLLGLPGEFQKIGVHNCGGDLMLLKGGIGRYVECKKCGHWESD